MKKQDYAEMKKEVTCVPEGNLFANGLYGYIANNQHKLTKSELVAILMELDYQMQCQADDSRIVNNTYKAMFNSELEEKLA